MKKLLAALLTLSLFIVLTGCSSDSNTGEVAGLQTNGETQFPATESAATDAPDDNVIIIDNKTDTLIYEDEYCSFTVKWINIGGVTASIKRKISDMNLAFYVEDMTIDGHPVNIGKYSNIIHNGQKFEGIGIYGMYSNDGVMTIFGPASRSDIVDWPGGEDMSEITFTLRVIDLNNYPDGEPNVSQRFTLRKAQ